jgi:hypothetical protein
VGEESVGAHDPSSKQEYRPNELALEQHVGPFRTACDEMSPNAVRMVPVFTAAEKGSSQANCLQAAHNSSGESK